MSSSEVPFIHTEIPGPKARRLLERQEKILVYTLPTWIPIVWEEGHGAIVTDVDGNRYIDFSSGVSVMNTGYSHPTFVKKLKDQVEKLSHCYFAPTEVQVEAMEVLASILPPPSGGWCSPTRGPRESRWRSRRLAPLPGRAN